VTRLAYGFEEAAEALSLSSRQVRRLVESGALRTFSVGRRRLIPHAELEAFTVRQVARHERGVRGRKYGASA
jgi:excisionase family DNA binding protein